MKKNIYGKLINGILHYASYPIIIDSIPTWTNDEKVYNEQGYFLIINTDRPIKNEYFYTSTYVEQDGKLVQIWEEHEIPKEIEEVIEESNSIEEVIETSNIVEKTV